MILVGGIGGGGSRNVDLASAVARGPRSYALGWRPVRVPVWLGLSAMYAGGDARWAILGTFLLLVACMVYIIMYRERRTYLPLSASSMVLTLLRYLHLLLLQL